MVSSEHEPITGIWGTEILVRGQGALPPDAGNFLRIGHPKKGANWPNNRRCMWQKSGGAQKPWSLKSGGLVPNSLTEVYAYDFANIFSKTTISQCSKIAHERDVIQLRVHVSLYYLIYCYVL